MEQGWTLWMATRRIITICLIASPPLELSEKLEQLRAIEAGMIVHASAFTSLWRRRY